MLDGFLAYLGAQVGRSLYVWGAQGETDITERWIRTRESSEANVQRVLRLWKTLKEQGVSPIAAYDCSGLIMHYLKDMTGFFKSDMTAAGLCRACAPVSRGALQRGDLLFRDNGTKVHHVGIYMGDGTAVEAEGRDVGVTRRALDAGGAEYWNRYGRLPLPGAPAAEAPKEAYFAVCSGGSVYLRRGPGAETQKLGTVHRGDKLLALPAEDGWCEVAAMQKNGIASGYMAERYVKRETMKNGE